jgi:hypothetical protein
VRYYTTNRIEGGMQFKCTRCELSVSTLDFDARYGNLRTQAATAIVMLPRRTTSLRRIHPSILNGTSGGRELIDRSRPILNACNRPGFETATPSAVRW